MIRFSRTNAPLLITDEEYETLGAIRPQWKITPCSPCATCGGMTDQKEEIKGYSLKIEGRYWGSEGLRPKGHGGAVSRHFKRLKDAKAMAEKVLG
jgi:hypothetical protein